MRDLTAGTALPDLFATETRAKTSRADRFRPPREKSVATLYQSSILMIGAAALLASSPRVIASLEVNDGSLSQLQAIIDHVGFWGAVIALVAAVIYAVVTTLKLREGRRELRQDDVARRAIYNRLRYVENEAGNGIVFDPVTGTEARPTYVDIQILVQRLWSREALGNSEIEPRLG